MPHSKTTTVHCNIFQSGTKLLSIPGQDGLWTEQLPLEDAGLLLSPCFPGPWFHPIQAETRDLLNLHFAPEHRHQHFAVLNVAWPNSFGSSTKTALGWDLFPCYCSSSARPHDLPAFVWMQSALCWQLAWCKTVLVDTWRLHLDAMPIDVQSIIHWHTGSY